VPDPQAQLPAFQRLVAGLAPQLGGLVRESGRALPGATEALTALAALADGRGGPDRDGWAGPLVQSVLTGNMQATALVKLAALDLDRYLDLRVGAYGDAHEIRADLVPLARARAVAAYGGDFAGRATVLIGDTPLDVEAARLTGARSVGVATGGFSMAELSAAGAGAVLPDLADTVRVLAAIAGGLADTLPSGDR
jgi:phosphoglycolate phosphatase-like HAD superfamily hydrolase